jgi:Bacterial Ig-like domain
VRVSGAAHGLGALALLFVLACARMGAPPGGPEDKVPPKLLATVPESVGVYPGWKHDVEFRFDEVISEGSSPSQGFGTGDLEKLILLSPSSRIPVINWKRDRLTLHPREGWQPNRVYRVQLLPGLMDLRRNRLDTTLVLTFSTGGALPTDTLRGIVIDWVAGRVAPLALVELVLRPDSLVYRTLTDSGGRYAIGPLPRGEYTVYGAIDQNHDLRREQRESYDSAEVASGAVAVAPLWLIPRDTLGPRITQVTANDSLSATIAFSQPLDPNQPIDSLGFSIRRQADSSLVPFHSLLPKQLDDSLQARERARADSVRAAADTTRADSVPHRLAPARPGVKPPPREPGRGLKTPAVDSLALALLKTRPKLYQELVLRTDSLLVPEAKYLVELKNIRSAAGVAGRASGVLSVPKARAQPKPTVDSLAPPTRTDSTAAAPKPARPLRKVKADSAAVPPPDSTAPPKPSR